MFSITRYITNASRFFTKAAASRILGIATGAIVRVQEFVNCVLVVGRHFCRFVSKQAFLRAYSAFRRQNAKNVAVGFVKSLRGGLDVYECESCHNPKNGASETHFVVVGEITKNMNCDCRDYQEANPIGGHKPPCKHLYATLGMLGYGSLAEFLKTAK